jgi:hypothetical protein
MPWLMVNHSGLCDESAVPTPLLALDVQRAGIPGAPGASPFVVICASCHVFDHHDLLDDDILLIIGLLMPARP